MHNLQAAFPARSSKADDRIPHAATTTLPNRNQTWIAKSLIGFERGSAALEPLESAVRRPPRSTRPEWEV